MGNSNLLNKPAIEQDFPSAPKSLRAGIYARYSSEGNSPYSANEQIERIRFRVQAGMVQSKLHPGSHIKIDESWVIKDEAQTGRVGREGYELIKSGVANRKFDVLLVDDISRATRDLGDTIDLYEALYFNELEGISISDGITTADPNAKDLFVFKGYANEAQSKNTSKNTIRGLEIRALKGFSTGNNPYGYYSQPTKMLAIKGHEKPSWFEIKVDYEKAKIVFRIWRDFADGKGCRTIAKVLNEEKIPAPQRGSSGTGKWNEKTVWNIANQEKYVGKWRYRQTKVLKNPLTDRLVQKNRPEKEHVILERDDLRIIPRELEKRVNERKAEILTERQQNKTASFYSKGSVAKHLFIGTMVCAKCGGNFVVASGKKGGYLGCFNAHRQASISCSNKQMVRMEWVESVLLSELHRQLDDSEIYKAIAKAYNEKMGCMLTNIPQQLNTLETELIQTEIQIKNYSRFISEGHWSDVIASNLAEAERKIKALRVERDYLKSQSQDRLFITPAAVKARMIDLGELLTLAMPEANVKIKKVFPEKIKMEPLQRGTKKLYRAFGSINLFALTEPPSEGRIAAELPYVGFDRIIEPLIRHE